MYIASSDRNNLCAAKFLHASRRRTERRSRCCDPSRIARVLAPPERPALLTTSGGTNRLQRCHRRFFAGPAMSAEPPEDMAGAEDSGTRSDPGCETRKKSQSRACPSHGAARPIPGPRARQINPWSRQEAAPAAPTQRSAADRLPRSQPLAGSARSAGRRTGNAGRCALSGPGTRTSLRRRRHSFPPPLLLRQRRRHLRMHPRMPRRPRRRATAAYATPQERALRKSERQRTRQ